MSCCEQVLFSLSVRHYRLSEDQKFKNGTAPPTVYSNIKIMRSSEKAKRVWKAFRSDSVTAIHVLQRLSGWVYTEIHNILLLYSALSVALRTESKVLVSDMGRVFHIWRVLLNESSWMIMLSRALWGGELCRLVTRQASWEDQFFAEILKQIKQAFFQAIHSFTGHAVSHLQTLTSTRKVFSFCRLFVSVCASVVACKVVCILYSFICMYTLLVDAVWMSNPAKLEPESLSCHRLLFHLWVSRKSYFAREIGFWQTDL